ncbi:MAG: PhoH family protein [Candidatus Aminicenantia bacterium]
MEKIIHSYPTTTALFGVLDRNLKKIEKRLKVNLVLRGDKLFIDGSEENVEFAKYFFDQIMELLEEGYSLREEDFQIALDLLEEDRSRHLKNFFPSSTLYLSRKSVAPKSFNQQKYIKAIKEYDLVFGIGPAGTGKTYLAMALALAALNNKEATRIILTRPAVEAGEKLGYLPGDMYQKVNPYLRPLYDALFDLSDAELASKLLEKGIIEIAPLAFMRGRTLNDAFIILDEAQNTTQEQMKMFLTRIGFNSKVVVTADITQIDLPQPKKSGVLQAIDILSRIEGIAFIYFNEKDVVRHPLVQKIIKAYEKIKKRTPQRDSSYLSLSKKK